jgi:hypothetical protein
MSFRQFRQENPDLSGPELLERFEGLASAAQDECWEALREQVEGGRE